MKKLLCIFLFGIFVLSGTAAKKRPYYIIRVNGIIDTISINKTDATKKATLLKKKNKNVIMQTTNTLPLK